MEKKWQNYNYKWSHWCRQEASMKQEIRTASLHLSLHRLPVDCKRDTKERADGHHLHEVIKVGITDKGTNWYHVPSENTEENLQHLPLVVLLNMFTWFYDEETVRSKLWDSLQDKKRQKQLVHSFRYRGNAIHDGRLELRGVGKDSYKHFEATWQMRSSSMLERQCYCIHVQFLGNNDVISIDFFQRGYMLQYV